jgi:hypothetical protein
MERIRKNRQAGLPNDFLMIGNALSKHRALTFTGGALRQELDGTCFNRATLSHEAVVAADELGGVNPATLRIKDDRDSIQAGPNG